MGWEGIGSLIGKISDWIPKRREYYQNKIAELRKELERVQDKKPFDAPRYIRITDQLRDLEEKERRAS